MAKVIWEERVNKVDRYMSVKTAETLVRGMLGRIKKAREYRYIREIWKADDMLNVGVSFREIENKSQFLLIELKDFKGNEKMSRIFFRLQDIFTEEEFDKKPITQIKSVLVSELRDSYHKYITSQNRGAQRTSESQIRESSKKSDFMEKIPKTQIYVQCRQLAKNRLSRKFEEDAQGIESGKGFYYRPLSEVNTDVKIDSRNKKVSINGKVYDLVKSQGKYYIDGKGSQTKSEEIEKVVSSVLNDVSRNRR